MEKNAEELDICAGDREEGDAGVLGGAEDGAEALGVEEGRGAVMLDEVGGGDVVGSWNHRTKSITDASMTTNDIQRKQTQGKVEDL